MHIELSGFINPYLCCLLKKKENNFRLEFFQRFTKSIYRYN